MKSLWLHITLASSVHVHEIFNGLEFMEYTYRDAARPYDDKFVHRLLQHKQVAEIQYTCLCLDSPLGLARTSNTRSEYTAWKEKERESTDY